MVYPNICAATFVERLNRFVAIVDIAGKPERVHVKNTGRLEGLLMPGAEVYLTAPGTANRKTTFDLVAARDAEGRLFNVDSQATNVVVGEWLRAQEVSRVVPEYRYGTSRIDFYLEREVKGVPERVLMEVKGCTLVRDGVGLFPDAPTVRGAKHLRELMHAVAEGYRSFVAFVAQTDGVSEVRAHKEMDAEFAATLKEAQSSGVTVLSLPCHVEPDSLEILPDMILPS